MRRMEQTWIGHGKKECLEAINQANRWIHSKRPDRFYDSGYAKRSMHIRIMGRDMKHWSNDTDGKVCDFIDTIYKQIENMGTFDFYYISVSFERGSWF